MCVRTTNLNPMCFELKEVRFDFLPPTRLEQRDWQHVKDRKREKEMFDSDVCFRWESMPSKKELKTSSLAAMLLSNTSGDTAEKLC